MVCGICTQDSDPTAWCQYLSLQIQFVITGILAEEQTRNMHLVDSRYPLLGCLGKVQHRTLLLALINWSVIVDTYCFMRLWIKPNRRVPYFISSGMRLYVLWGINEDLVADVPGVFFIMTVYKLRPKSKTGSMGSVTNPLPLHEGFLKGGALCFLT